MSDAAFEQYEKLFVQDFGLHPYDNEWDGIGTASIKEIAYCSPFSTGAKATPCAPGILENPTGSLSDENGGVNFIYRRNSNVAYLEYSAFFLNRSFAAYVGGFYNNPSNRLIYRGAIGGDHPLAASVGSLSPTAGDQNDFISDDIGSPVPPMVTGTWKGGMIGVAYDDSGSGMEHCAHTCTYEQLSPRPLTGNVTFTVSTAEGRDRSIYANFPYEIEFSNIVDPDGEKMAGWTWTGNVLGEYVPNYPERGPLFLGRNEIRHYDIDQGQSMRGYFYGPSYEEIGGVFHRNIPAEDVTEGRDRMEDSFGARRQ